MATQTSDILTPEQAASYLQVNRETIYRYIRDGRLTASRIGRSYRIRKQSIDLLLSATRTRSDIPVRRYSDQQLADFLQADRLDSGALEVIHDLRTRTPAAAHESH
jgi:excisionase family DNA binding protein